MAQDIETAMKVQNMNIRNLFLVMTIVVGLVPAVYAAQDFSADVMYRPSGKPGARPAEISSHAPSRLYVSKDKMRLETRGLIGTVLLVNGGDQTAFALVPSRKEYEPVSGGLAEYFHVKDAENACSEWQSAMAKKINCEKVGHEVVDGRQTVKYRNKDASHADISAVWIDESVKFVVKWESAETAGELRNIQEAQQAVDLFRVPDDYAIPKPRKGSTRGFSSQ